MKCNYDVSHHEGNTNSGMGWIIRNSTGLCLDCGMGQFQGRSNIMEAEGSALIWAMQACWSLGYKNVIFEGDNFNLNQLLDSTETNLMIKVTIRTIQQWRMQFQAAVF